MEIRLDKMRLLYFKGQKDLEIQFNYPTTTISGGNATGKTTVFDAFTWLLFGKDSEGHTDTGVAGFAIKTVENGKTIEQVDHEVSAILYVDGRKVTLRRILREDWVKKRGESSPVLTGNTTVCYFDEVPVSIGEYTRRVNDLLEENLFRLITNPLYFNGLNWKDKRNVLLSMSGNITDNEIADLSKEFKDLLSSLNGKTIEDFRLKIAAEKAKINEEFKQLPIRIDTVRKGMPQPEEWKALEAEIAARQVAIDNIDKAIADKAQASKQEAEKELEIQQEINRLKRERLRLINEEEKRVEQLAYESQAGNRAIDNEVKILKDDISLCKQELQRRDSEWQNITNEITRIGDEIVNLRTDFSAENAKKYTLSDTAIICPIYGHQCTDSTAAKLHEEGTEKACEAFNLAKRQRLETINSTGKAKVERLAEAKIELTKTENEIKRLEMVIEKSEKSIRSKLSEKTITASQPIPGINTNDIPGYTDLVEKIKTLEDSLTIREATIIHADLIGKKKALQFEIDGLRTRLNVKDRIAADEKRLNDYSAQQQLLSQQIADLEAQEFTAQNFVKAKMEELERRVNSQFTLVQFKMFKEQVNGGEKDDCIALMEGVPYDSKNNAMKINGGIDIINALCKYHNVNAPIFIDNREGINELIPCNSQIINLYVTQDKQLSIN